MLRYLLHRTCGHSIVIAGKGYAGFYNCWTCCKRWNGLFFRAGRHWTTR